MLDAKRGGNVLSRFSSWDFARPSPLFTPFALQYPDTVHGEEEGRAVCMYRVVVRAAVVVVVADMFYVLPHAASTLRPPPPRPPPHSPPS